MLTAACTWLNFMGVNLKELYSNFIKNKGLENDPGQFELVNILDQYKPSLETRNQPLIKRIFSKGSPNKEEKKKGIYIYGDVGRGKSMIMDLFYNSLNLKNKQRIHFHQFMLDFHNALHKYREEIQSISNSDDQVIMLAKQIAKKATVICLDELQVNNIADAMIVDRLFTAIIGEGTFIVITSNRHPEELFKDGLQRERFVPFIDLIKQNFLIFHLNNFKDYRLDKLTCLDKLFFSPLNQETKDRINEIIGTITGNKKLERKELFIEDNKILKLERTYGNIAVFTFNELCLMPLGAIDYFKIAQNFNTLVIEDIPELTNDNHNEALRFITLIDCLYENHTRLICSAANPIEKMYNGTRNRFEFGRTISRLTEMQSAEYMMAPQKP
ncbi:AFG1-like ATPase [Candidatus Jidaibacter acanthamoeba]|uniref:AFG1-like ATPase n=1 Tax=Candidatus Jidaibacter acanthamoebae TaxID=86105 RepID=A0A0C1MZI7_9RICK|nr:cell division protein ZapE [Candidatus Jidaibacter acanthamoeba]KIE05491.1 AFG1-like ATPase [Candidatus Jidaibacter acanthamoeba]